MEFTYTPHGVCSRQILLELDGNKVSNVRFIGGCSGNTQGVARLAEGMDVDELISRLEGIRCGVLPGPARQGAAGRQGAAERITENTSSGMAGPAMPLLRLYDTDLDSCRRRSRLLNRHSPRYTALRK